MDDKSVFIDGFTEGTETFEELYERFEKLNSELKKSGKLTKEQQIKIETELIFTENQIRKYTWANDAIRQSENMTFSDFKSLPKQLSETWKNETDIKEGKTSLQNAVNDYFNAEKTDNLEKTNFFDKLANDNAIAFIETLQAGIDILSKQIESKFKEYITARAGKDENIEQLYNYFMDALNQIEQNGTETAIIFAFKHFQELKDGKPTPEAVKAEKILNTAYEKAITAKNKKTKTTDTYIETLTNPVFKYYFPNDKISNSLEKLIIDGNQIQLAEEKQDGTAKKEVTSYISFDFDEAAKETDLAEFTLTFSEFDKQVQEAVVSLMKAGNKIITPFMIYKTLTGNGSKQISEKWENDIMKSMKKFNSVNVTADLTETAKYYPDLQQVETLVKQTRLMQFEKTYVKSKNGSEVYAYKMLTEPILYTIANAKRQVGTLDIKLLENSKTSNTIDNTELKIYLLKRINSMKHGQSTNIVFETIYKSMGRTTTQNQRTTRANAEKLLLQFKADKIIKDFEIEIKGRKPVKIKITM